MKDRSIAFDFSAELGTAMRARIDEGTNLSVGSTAENDRPQSDRSGLEIARL